MQNVMSMWTARIIALLTHIIMRVSVIWKTVALARTLQKIAMTMIIMRIGNITAKQMG